MSVSMIDETVKKSVVQEVEGALAQWLGHIANKSLQGIRDAYTPGALLDPTLTPELLSTVDEREAYFAQMFKADKLWCEVTSRVIEVGSADFATVEGRYQFHFCQNNEPKTIKAKFVLIFHRLNGKLRICGHTAAPLPNRKI